MIFFKSTKYSNKRRDLWNVHLVYLYLLFSGCTTSGTFRTNRGQAITMNPFRIRNVYVFGMDEDNKFKMASVNQTGDFLENRYHEKLIGNVKGLSCCNWRISTVFFQIYGDFWKSQMVTTMNSWHQFQKYKYPSFQYFVPY